jgi:uncharacterized protein YndB with AHSA1/START domain
MPDTLRLAMTGETDITFTRDFAASPALVWRAMTEPALIAEWLWARQAPMTLCEVDFRVGGRFRWVWEREAGGPLGVSGRYLEIAAPHRMVHTEIFDEDWTGGETTVTTCLTEPAPQTTRMAMTVRYASAAARDAAAATAMAEGMDEAYRRLDALLPAIRDAADRSDFRIVADGADRLVVTRSFAAPVERLRRAHLDADLMRQWYGSDAYPVAAVEVDARVGGRFRIAWTTPDGSPLELIGHYESLSPTRIVHVEHFLPDWTQGPARVVTDFIATGARTQVRTVITYTSPAARDAVGASGMAEGMAATYDRLETILAGDPA